MSNIKLNNIILDDINSKKLSNVNNNDIMVYRPKKIKEKYQYTITYETEKDMDMNENKITQIKLVLYGNFINWIKLFKSDEKNNLTELAYHDVIPNQGLHVGINLNYDEKFIIEVNPIDICTKIQIKNLSSKILDNNCKITWDNIFIINLVKRADRKEEMIKKLELANITKYEFIEAIDGMNPEIIGKFNMAKSNPDFPIVTSGHYACLLSHINAIKLAKERDYNTIMILEDDVYFCNEFLLKLDNLQVCQYDMLYLGGITSKKKLFFDDWILNSSNNKIMGAYGYMLKCHMFPTILEKLEKLMEYVDLLYIKQIQPNYNVILLNDYITTDLASSNTSNKSKKLVKRLKYIN